MADSGVGNISSTAAPDGLTYRRIRPINIPARNSVVPQKMKNVDPEISRRGPYFRYFSLVGICGWCWRKRAGGGGSTSKTMKRFSSPGQKQFLGSKSFCRLTNCAGGEGFFDLLLSRWVRPGKSGQGWRKGRGARTHFPNGKWRKTRIRRWNLGQEILQNVQWLYIFFCDVSIFVFVALLLSRFPSFVVTIDTPRFRCRRVYYSIESGADEQT